MWVYNNSKTLVSRPFVSKADFENVFKEYFNPLVNFVNKYLHNIENSKEVVQITFVKIWNNREQIEIKTSVNAYLYQIAKNSMIDFIRKNKHNLAHVELNILQIEQLPDDNASALDPYFVRQAIEKALIPLKPKSREIFELNKFEGLSYEEIAEYLEISKRSVEDNISKVLKHLKEELKNHPYFFD